MCGTVQYSTHGHICRYVSKSYKNMKGHGRYRHGRQVRSVVSRSDVIM